MDKRELEITATLAMLSTLETTRIEAGIQEMLGHFEKMMEVDVDGLEPTTHALVKDNRTREDVPVQDETNAALLDNAPAKEDRFFLIPNVL